MEDSTWSVTYALIAIVSTLLAGVLLHYVYLVLYYRNKCSHLPSPKPISFLFGHTPALRDAYNHTGTVYELLRKWAEELGPVFVMFTPCRPMVITWSPDGVKELLVTGNFPKAEELYQRNNKMMNLRWLGIGLVTDADHERWQKRRHAINPAFQKSALKALMEEFNTISDRLVDKVGNHADNKEMFEMCPLFSDVALDIIGKVGFAKDMDSIFGINDSFNKRISEILAIISKVSRDPFNKLPGIWHSLRNRMKANQDYVRDSGRKWVEERMAAIKKGEYVPEDILGQLIKMREDNVYEDMEVLLDDLLTIIMAGHETTANTISFVILEVCRHPQIMKRLYEEVDEVIGQKRHISAEDINKLNYMKLVWKETLRLYPAAPFTFREVDRVGFKIDGKVIPKGTTIWMTPYVSGRMPSLVKNPLDFKPERFLPDSPDRPNTYGYFPFSLGPRNCIGQNFANMEGAVIVAKLLQNFNIKLDPTQSFAFREFITLRPKDNVRVTVSWRKTN